MMKQAQKMQEDMQKAQQEIANMEVEGQAGGGMVKVVMNGRHELRRDGPSYSVDTLLDESNDPYITLRESFRQNREYEIYDGDPPVEDDYYEFLDEDDL